MTAARVAALLIVAALCGCSVLFAVSDDSASGGADAGGDASGEDGAAQADGQVETGIVCPTGKPGPALVPAGSFCIDATEVSISMYEAFVAAADKSAVEPHPDCAGNVDFALHGDAGTAEQPALVDWCDARAYCRWAGKRLCGALGDGGVITRSPSSGIEPLLNREMNEWLSACEGGREARTYPYGLDLIRDACAPAQRGAPGEPTSYQGLAPIGTRPDCEGGYPGLFDMGGNAQEWINAQTILTRLVDGSQVPWRPFYAMGVGDECRSTAGPLEGTDPRHGYGIRCCWSP